VGAARFLRGLARVIDPKRLRVIGNTADDEEFFGLHVSPDLDTLTYTLADVAPVRRGWGIADDTFASLGALARFYTDAWFRIGDRDLATHLYRTHRLRTGAPLSQVTREIARRFGVRATMFPMTDARVRTFVHTGRGRRPFQTYLVHDRARGAVRRITFEGIGAGAPAPGVLEALRTAAAIIIPPSNPIVSIGPILALPGIRSQLRRSAAPIAAISPIIAGRTVRGSADRMLRGLGIEASPVGVATLYRDIVDLFVIDSRDAAAAPRIEALGCAVLVADTLLTTPARAATLARSIIDALSVLRRRRRQPRVRARRSGRR
jgi:LPPG:FO 2-phospho-L-lactate transferase